MVLEPLPLNINTCHIYVGFYNDDIQQESIGIHTCDVDMVSALPTDRKEILLIAHNSDDDCRFILEYLQNVEPIAKKSDRSSQIKARYYNPKSKKEVNTTVTGSYKLIPMPLRDVGKCFKLDVSKEAMSYNVYTYENVSMGACRIQDALDIF